MPLASFVMTQPAWLAVAAALLWTAAAGGVAERAAGGRWATGLRVAAGAVISGLTGAVLVVLGGAVAEGLLLAMGVAGGAALAVRRYAREATALSTGGRRAAVALRTAAWLVVLVLVGRPAVDHVRVTFQKPLLAVLLDQSASMALTDPGSTAGTRAAQVEAALAATSAARTRLAELYDVRLLGFGSQTAPLSGWVIRPESPLTGLATALETAAELQATDGRSPAAVLIVSDGAENVGDSAGVRSAADALNERRTPLRAVGVGPEPGTTPMVELDPLAVPPRMGGRDRLPVVGVGRVRGCGGQSISVEVCWNDTVVATTELPVGGPDERIAPRFDILPPGPGAHRLSVRATLPATLGGATAESSAIVEVGADWMRVVYVEQGPRTESAFVLRSLRSDPRVEVTPVFLMDGGDEGGDWSNADVIIIGRLTQPLPPGRAEEVAAAVLERGVGLLLGHGESLRRVDPAGALAVVVPVRAGGAGERPTTRRFVPTAAGLRHAVLEGLAGEAAAGTESQPAGRDDAERWASLPALVGAIQLAEPKPAATVLATDGNGRPLLAGQEAGRGRCLMAGWESTWPWALHSDFGSGVHRLLWRQMVAWLANRRPRAWVVTEQGEYAAAALSERPVRVRAGVTGLEAGSEARGARLTLMKLEPSGRPGAGVAVDLKRAGPEWVAELPQAGVIELSGGAYLLEFAVSAAAATRGPAGGTDELVAYTRFEIETEDLERRRPTSNLGLLREAAERTAACGGKYARLADWPQVLAELTREDRRTRQETAERWAVVDREPGVLLAVLVGLLTAEWIVRKGAGLA